MGTKKKGRNKTDNGDRELEEFFKKRGTNIREKIARLWMILNKNQSLIEKTKKRTVRRKKRTQRKDTVTKAEFEKAERIYRAKKKEEMKLRRRKPEEEKEITRDANAIAC